MSSNPPAIPTSSKASAPSGQLSPAQTQPGSAATGDGYGQRRSGSSFGAGAASRASPTPRSAQQGRKQHKTSKRFARVDDDAIAESLNMRPFNSRKGQTNITHLMNFSLPPRPQNHHSNGHGRGYRRNPTWGLGSGYHATDKARYVHANYRFIVDPRGDYRAQSVDADIHLDWNNVLQILASSQSQDASCPICLGTPVAPRMAKCGHIFCLPCLIRYMHSEDEGKGVSEKRARSKKCPLCWDSIYISETRPVRWYMGQEGLPPREGGDVVLRLVMRSAGSTLAMPRDGADALGKETDIPWYHAAEVMDYARMMRGGEDYMLEQFDAEVHQLKQQEKEDELMFGEDNIEWMRKAIRSIQESKEKVKGVGNPPQEPAKPSEPKPKKAPIVFHEVDEDTPTMYSLQNAAKSGQSLPSQAHIPVPDTATGDQLVNGADANSRRLSMSSHSSKTSHGLGSTLAEIRNRQQHDTQHTPSEYFFYQALLHYYLSPLDIRILKSAFGDFATFPSTILPRVERVSTGHVIDDDLRKRTKYLAHLPYGCEVCFLECDWTDTVAPEILEKFKPEIEKRRKRHYDKESKEEKARLRAEKAEYAEFAAARRKRNSISERFSAEDFQPLASGSIPVETVGQAGEESASTSPPWPPRRGGQGFASLASPSTSPSTSRTVWGTAAIAATSPIMAPLEHNAQDDGWLQGWEKDLLNEEDAMVAQAQVLSVEDSEAPKKQAGGKKKKAKKITLMSTNARRGA
ncbi:uncharacterized protein N0V89_003264 [Didymosphaeria variabile]|uniref:RING-type domain-containing protein n=1 Tax=Didymosphaeria variabile TaxID=1932322 RepID=A0A9W8XVS1_9PLEO|nr:uncharacterized protein N0V89_003264 [Didymosphaeria variabile]KAJ4358680.1 hypothetical protein N0V89_003264 [Didymosphaeria variabile]